MINIELDATVVNRILTRTRERMTDCSDLMRQIAESMKFAVDQNFATEGAHSGDKWLPSQRAIKQHGRTLQDTGRLAASIQIAFANNYAEVGTNVEYAAIHQFGGAIRHGARSQRAAFKVNMATGRSRFAKRKDANFEQWVTIGEHSATMPARPFLRLAAADLRDIENLARRFVLP